MISNLLPLFERANWSGGTLSEPSGRDEEVRGRCWTIQWLGFLIEIGAGRVRRIAPTRHASISLNVSEDGQPFTRLTAITVAIITLASWSAIWCALPILCRWVSSIREILL